MWLEARGSEQHEKGCGGVKQFSIFGKHLVIYKYGCVEDRRDMVKDKQEAGSQEGY